uniref:Uncharacterized protein n=1 Tax=Arundo donax TaxID=35708 RepID=A0A0A9H462_ARUDO
MKTEIGTGPSPPPPKPQTHKKQFA